MKYIYISFLLFFALNCNQAPKSKSITEHKVVKPEYHSLIDSTKYKDVIFRLDTLFSKLYNSGQLNANVLVVKGNDVIYKKSFGYADIQKQIFLNDSSLFQLASVSKVITSIGILKLAESGRLDIDTKVDKILPDFPYKKMTVRHLLAHRSGLPNYTYFLYKYPEFINKYTLTNYDVLEAMKKYKPQLYFSPNYRFNYCNTNYAILAIIIEKISGLQYAEFLDKEIFKPIGMNHTKTVYNVDSSSVLLTKGYTMNYQKVENDKFDGVIGDKGIISTTNDLMLLSLSLYQGKILSFHTQQMAYQPHSKEKKQSNYGLGWRMKNIDNSEKEVFHNGWWHGYRTAFHRRLKDSITVIVLSNRLNKSVYATGKVFAAIDGPKSNYFDVTEED